MKTIRLCTCDYSNRTNNSSGYVFYFDFDFTLVYFTLVYFCWQKRTARWRGGRNMGLYKIQGSTCCRFKTWAISFTPRCRGSPGCINVYLAIDSGIDIVFVQ